MYFFVDRGVFFRENHGAASEAGFDGIEADDGFAYFTDGAGARLGVLAIGVDLSFCSPGGLLVGLFGGGEQKGPHQR